MFLPHFFLSLCLSFCLPLHSNPYLSPTTLFPNYQNMLQSFKIFSYSPPQPQTLVFSTRPESLFFSSLLNSSFITRHPEEAHLFFIPFSWNISTRSLARFVNAVRNDFPFWNRTLGADHFYVSCEGLSFGSDRNILELKKNSVQISCFPTPRNRFVPHKDITLPPLTKALHAPTNKAKTYLGYVRYGAIIEHNLIEGLSDDPEFLVDSEPMDQLTYVERLGLSKFCLFEFGQGDVSRITEAVLSGCVPVVITDSPIQDMPLMDVLRWQEIALFVGWDKGKDGVEVEELKRVLRGTFGDERYGEVRGLCVTAGQHFVWNEEPQTHDAFHMVMYQLWLRRHTIRYARREMA